MRAVEILVLYLVLCCITQTLAFTRKHHELNRHATQTSGFTRKHHELNLHGAPARNLLFGWINFSAVGCDGTFAECLLRINNGKFDILTGDIGLSDLGDEEFSLSPDSIPLRVDEIEEDLTLANIVIPTLLPPEVAANLPALAANLPAGFVPAVGR
eukprot:Selendium_serpulae@DN6249_c0_g1_i11.p1